MLQGRKLRAAMDSHQALAAMAEPRATHEQLRSSGHYLGATLGCAKLLEYLLALTYVYLRAQSSLVQSCNATAHDLFAPRYNVTEALREYNSADAAARAVVPHPGTGFTFFLPSRCRVQQ